MGDMNDKMKDFLDKLTDNNWHTERLVVEAIMSGRADVMSGACDVWRDHMDKGYLTTENQKKREELYKLMEEE